MIAPRRRLQATRMPMRAPAPIMITEFSKARVYERAGFPPREKGNAAWDGRFQGIHAAFTSRNQATRAPTMPAMPRARALSRPSPAEA